MIFLHEYNLVGQNKKAQHKSSFQLIRKCLVSSISFKEAKRTFLTPLWSLDFFFFLNIIQLVQNKEAQTKSDSKLIRKCFVFSISFKEAKRKFLTPEWSQDIFLLHISSSWGQMKQHIKNEAHIMPGSTPSPPCPLRKLRGRS